MKITSKLCPVCLTWFHPEPRQQKYCKPLCKRLGQSINAGKRRRSARKL